MTMHSYRTRTRVTLGAIALGAIALAPACSSFRDQVLSPQQPGIISPDQVQSPTAADALRKGALSRFRVATVGINNGEGIWTLGGMLTDEWKSGDTFSQRNETDQRIIQLNNAEVIPMYQAVQRARGAAYDAINALVAFIPDTLSKQAEMYWVLGSAELGLAENWCSGVPYGTISNGVPNYTDPLTSAQGFALALSHLDSGLAFATATDTFTVSVNHAIQIARARALVDMGGAANMALAVTAAGTVPTNYQFLQTYSLTTADNAIWSMNTSQKRWVVGDSFDTGGRILNALPFASAADPRIPVTGTSLASTLKTAFDNQTQLVSQSIYGRSDPVPLATGIDARLIEAEAQLQANNIGGMMTILNTLRGSTQKIGVFTVPVMAALPTPGSQAAATALFFRESAFWQFSRGMRLSADRRQIRQYGLTQDQVFPTGQFSFKGGGLTYGTDVNFPVTTDEKPNPKWTACIDRNA